MKHHIYDIPQKGLKFALFTQIPHFKESEFLYTIVNCDIDERTYCHPNDIVKYESMENIRAYLDWCLTHYQYAAVLLIKDNHGRVHEKYILSEQDAKTNIKNFELVVKYLKIRAKVEAVNFDNTPWISTKPHFSIS